MSYLSRRMREDGWPASRRRPHVRPRIRLHVDVDITQFTAAVARMDRQIDVRRAIADQYVSYRNRGG